MDFHGEKRTNATHRSTTDAEARLAKTGTGHEAKLAYHGHVVMKHRHGLVMAAEVTPATGTAERDTAGPLLRRVRRFFHRQGRLTLGADRGYDSRQLVADLRAAEITPHLAPGIHTTLDARTTRHPGYAIGQRKRKQVEEVFGWRKTVGPMRQTRYRGRQRLGWMFTFATAVYNLVRLRTLTTVSV